MTRVNPSGRRRPRTFPELTGVLYDQTSLPYVIPSLERDDPRGMFVTAELARRSEDPLVYGMYDTIRSFYTLMNELLHRARKGDQLAWRKAVRIASFPEVAELGFGYTQESRHGRGTGAGSVCQKILDTLRDFPGLAELCMAEPDAIAFVPGVGLDRVSDAIGTIAKLELITYTQQQAQLHDFDPRCMDWVVVPNVWNGRTQMRESVRVKLPIADDGRAILLVDKSIVRSSPPVRAEQYARTYNLSHLSSDALKRRILEQNRNDASSLRRVMRDVFSHEYWIRPRRDFR
jgi:hypothetical protein